MGIPGNMGKWDDPNSYELTAPIINYEELICDLSDELLPGDFDRWLGAFFDA